MLFSRQLRKFFLLAGDVVIFYSVLVGTLWIRYLEFPTARTWAQHSLPFFFVHLLWIVVLYVAGLYEAEKFFPASILRHRLLRAMAIAGLFAVLLFYLVPAFLITPKTNLLIDLAFVTMFLWLWRRLFLLFVVQSSKINVLFLGISKEVLDFSAYLRDTPQLGYAPKLLVRTDHSEASGNADVVQLNNNLRQLIRAHQIQLVIIAGTLPRSDAHTHMLYDILPLGIAVIDFVRFYEDLTGKIPVSLIGELWFLQNIYELEKYIFETFKRMLDVALAIAVGIVVSPVLFLTAIAVRLIRGETLYRQARVGKNGKIFELIKFGTMRLDAEKNGAVWAKEDDERVIPAGNFLRKTRIDELPQIWNVLKGDMSFVGPRPERPEFVTKLKEEIPHYGMRLLVKPGLSGWAQVNFPYGASVEDAVEKLQYDLFYIKRRSLSLEAAILLRTLAVILRRSGR